MIKSYDNPLAPLAGLAFNFILIQKENAKSVTGKEN